MLLTLLLACSSGALEINPDPLDFGQVDFISGDDCEPEDGGCEEQIVTITNTGERELVVSLPDGYDRDHICLSGYDEADGPIELGSLGPGSRFELLVSVCGYIPGELGTELSGTLRASADKADPVELTWIFTPIRDIPTDDTGDGR